jgi:guanylate kinase
MPDSDRIDSFVMLIVSSPSGAGKTTLCSRLRAEFGDLRFSVSHTTRQPRPTEVDGREYHFVDEATFQQMVRAQAFAEWARVHDHHYGTSCKEIEISRAAGQGIIFDIDFQGARQIRAHYPEAIGVFILPPSLEELDRRLRGRRLANAKREIAHYGLFDYVIVNDDIELAYGRLRSLVFAERCRRRRLAHRCEQLLTASQEEEHWH